MRHWLALIVRIGIDFDNTIVSYDSLFHRVAVERNLVPGDLPATKLSVRDYLRQSGKEDIWTEMQGYVYGARMGDAVAYPGALEFFEWARKSGITTAIVSHKTRHPFLGRKYDLHEAARGWVDRFLIRHTVSLINAENVYFELTKGDKLARVAQLDLDFFIDDLPEILLAEAFPERTGRVLFDPDRTHARDARMVSFAGWDRISEYLEGRCKSGN